MATSTLAANNQQHGSNQQTHACTITVQEFTQLLESRPSKWKHGSQSCRQIHLVPSQLRLNVDKNKRIYEPVMVALGPYHHGNPELQRAEEFKYLCLHSCASQSDETKAAYYNSILERINEIRGCYAEVSIVNKYEDKDLALMMLLDACFILNFMENCDKTRNNNFLEWHNCLGVAAPIPFAARDIVLLENQIPFQVLELIKSQDGEELLQKFVSWMLMIKFEHAAIPRVDEDPPLHLLEAYWRVIVGNENTNFIEQQPYNRLWLPKFMNSRGTKEKDDRNEQMSYHTSRSVTDLKAKGIHVRPSSSHSLKDIKFKSYAFYGRLNLPVRYIGEITEVILSNLIAYEICPDTKTDLAVLSYTNFMKSLIESPEDVKELQEKGILFNRFANHERVVEVFKNIDTLGLVNFDIFRDVKLRVGKHCSNKGKTWVANLIHTRFQSPWSVIAFLAATLLLCLTFLQTYFTINPAKR